MGQMFSKLAQDETAAPELRQWGLQQFLEATQTGYKSGKPYQPDFSTFPKIRPGKPAQGVTQPPVGAGPPPPPQGLTGSFTPPQAAPMGAPLGAGAAGPPAPAASAEAPPISFAPPPLPPTLASQPGQSVTLAAQPPQPIQPFMSPEQVTQLQASRTG